MHGSSIVSRAFEVFQADAAASPPLTLAALRRRTHGGGRQRDAIQRAAAARVGEARATLFRDPVQPRSIVVAGSPRAQRLDGLTHGDSPAEPQALAIVFATAREELVTLSIRSWPRDDITRAVARILASFEIV